MRPRFRLRPRDHLERPASKQAFNLALFSVVARRYDTITKVLSLGRDGAWKRDLVDHLPRLEAPVCVDLACGTGDITRLVATRYPGGKVTGLDLTAAMLDRARGHRPVSNIDYCEGTMHALPFEAASVDLVTGGYALRNAPDLERALDEIGRVLRPGGTAAFLDFSKCSSRAGQWMGHALLKGWGGFWGVLFHGNPDVYGYIADSLQKYPDRDALLEALTERGLILIRRRRFYGGLLESLILTMGER